MLPRLAVLTAVATLATAAGAQAKPFCVADPSCADQKTTIADAVKAASDNPGPDEVRIGPGTFDESFAYAGNDQVTITGAGRGLTRIVSAPKKESVVDLERATISDLSIRALENSGSTGGLHLVRSTARRVDVAQDSQDREAVRLGDGGLLEDSTVTSQSIFGDGVIAQCPGGCTVRRSSLHGTVALGAVDGAAATAEDVRAYGAVGAGEDAKLDVRRSIVAPADMPWGLIAFGGAIDARQTTVVWRGEPHPDSVGLLVLSGIGMLREQRADTPQVRLEGVAIDGFAASISRSDDIEARSGGRAVTPASIVAHASAWDRSREFLVPSKPGLALSDIVDLAGRGARFRDPAAGDYHLRSDSPLVDAIPDPVPATFRDLDGNAATDGNADGITRADIGVFEAPTGTRAVTPPPAADPAPPAAVAPTLPSVRAILDRIAPRLSKARIVKGRLLVRLSERARLRITVSRRARRSLKKVRTFTVAAKAGDNRIKLSLPRRGGRYSVAVVALDAAGNRSAQKQLALRVR